MTETAPERISLDVTGEDANGFFVAARTSDGYRNHDTPYVRADLLDEAQRRIDALEKALANVMGYVDTPISRRRLGIKDPHPEWLMTARAALDTVMQTRSTGKVRRRGAARPE